jgi:hypothetical protein
VIEISKDGKSCKAIISSQGSNPKEKRHIYGLSTFGSKASQLKTRSSIDTDLPEIENKHKVIYLQLIITRKRKMLALGQPCLPMNRPIQKRNPLHHNLQDNSKSGLVQLITQKEKKKINFFGNVESK